MIHIVMKQNTFASTGNKNLIDSSKAWVNCKVALGDSLKFSKQNSILQVPEMNTLIFHIE